MIEWYWRYIPCRGVKLQFEQLALYPDSEPTLLHLQRRDPQKRIKIRRKHIREDYEGAFKKIDEIDFELALRSRGGDGSFDFDPVHVFSFLLMIRTTGWISAPAILTSSMLDEPEAASPDIFCMPFIESIPTHYRETVLSLEDAIWIRDHISVGLRFTNERIFQNAMQSLTSFHCVPYANVCLLLAWSGLEALFGTSSELSFRLSLYIANFLKREHERDETFERLRKSYDARSKVTHGSGDQVENLSDHANYTRDILRACLAKCIEQQRFPDPKRLVFGE